MLNREFLLEFKETTELNWSQQSINPAACGFQFQRGTGWNPGPSNAESAKYCEQKVDTVKSQSCTNSLTNPSARVG